MNEEKPKSDFTLHNVVIRALNLLDPRVETGNFRKKLITLLTSLAKKTYDANPEKHDENWTLAAYLAALHSISILKDELRDVPDAFVIDEDREEILIFEVEDFHVMSADKVWRIVDLADAIISEFSWNVRIFVSDRYANLKELDIELLQASITHELGAIRENIPKGQKPVWHPRCMRVRHNCRKCGKYLKGNELYEHRYDCSGDAEDSKKT